MADRLRSGPDFFEFAMGLRATPSGDAQQQQERGPPRGRGGGGRAAAGSFVVPAVRFFVPVRVRLRRAAGHPEHVVRLSRIGEHSDEELLTWVLTHEELFDPIRSAGLGEQVSAGSDLQIKVRPFFGRVDEVHFDLTPLGRASQFEPVLVAPDAAHGQATVESARLLGAIVGLSGIIIQLGRLDTGQRQLLVRCAQVRVDKNPDGRRLRERDGLLGTHREGAPERLAREVEDFHVEVRVLTTGEHDRDRGGRRR